MPKETFFNLPDEKRERITAVAIEEFGHNEYADVSISRIVAKAGIAKGSFYQYFVDKEDLYSYLLDLIAQRKTEAFSLDQPDPQHMGIFQYLHWLIRAGVGFELANRELMQVGYRAFNQTGYPKAFAAQVRQESRRFFMRLVATGKEQGDIAPEIDDELAAFIFDAVFTGLGQYLMSVVDSGETFEKTFHGERTLMEHPEVVRIFEQTMELLEHGMGVCRSAPAGAAVTAQERHKGDQEVEA